VAVDAMTFVPYKPPALMFNDTFLAYGAFASPHIGVLIEPDPLGPVNKILTLVCGDRRIKSALHPVGVGTVCRVERETGGYSLTEVFALRERRWGDPESDIGLPPRRAPGWHITIDGRTVLYATEAEVHPPSPLPRVPWRTRAHKATRTAVRTRVRALGDQVAGSLGYHHEDDCDRGDW
jgi:hypothetical protein